jgi:Cd(II)/Pb(II)-responsive transcriptional regulator
MKIGELAKAAGLPVETVRFYEKQGLLPAPARHENNYRRYDEQALQRLRFIGNCRALDMSLDEVRTLLDFIEHPHADCSPVDALVAEHLGHVRQRMAELKALEKQLKLLQSACGHARPQELCGIVLALSSGPALAPARRGVHSSR